MNETLSVTAINTGTVIDHITAGQALRIIHLLSLKDCKQKITIGLNLPSKRLGLKDILKIEDRVLTKTEANEIAIFAPVATINVIKDFKVTDKIKTRLPDTMRDVFICPNAACITQNEPVESRFYISEQGKCIKLTCHYCDKIFDRDRVKVKI